MAETTVGVIGIWHLGAVYSACLADLGCRVVGFDSDRSRVADLNKGVAPLFEPGLAEMIAANIAAKRLSYTGDLTAAVGSADFVWITLDTPVDDNDDVDLSPVTGIVGEMAAHLKNGVVVIVSSQVPVGTCEKLAALIKERRPGLQFGTAYSPENLRLGQAIGYFKKPDRIVVGADSETTLDRIEDLLRAIPAPKLRMDLKSAEMAKHAINAFLATTICFANEIGNLCDEVGADALKVAEALRTESRIGSRLPLSPGLGFAGGTLARDIKVLRQLGDDAGYETALIDSVLATNRKQNGLVVRKLKKQYGSLKGLSVAVLGLTYKAGTSTMRRSASLEIIHEMVSLGARVRAYDPKADMSEIKGTREFEPAADPYAAAIGADALVLITDWPEFRTLDFDRLKSVMRKPVFIDARNMFYGAGLDKKGFVYSGVGTGR